MTKKLVLCQILPRQHVWRKWNRNWKVFRFKLFKCKWILLCISSKFISYKIPRKETLWIYVRFEIPQLFSLSRTITELLAFFLKKKLPRKSIFVSFNSHSFPHKVQIGDEIAGGSNWGRLSLEHIQTMQNLISKGMKDHLSMLIMNLLRQSIANVQEKQTIRLVTNNIMKF